MAILKELEIPVVDNRGALVQPGYVQSRADPFLYQFEVQAVSARPSVPNPLSQFTALFLAKKIQVPAITSAPALANAVHAAVRAVRRHPSEPGSEGVLIVDALSKTQRAPEDLAHTPAAKMTLDSLQEIILTDDLVAAAGAHASKKLAQTASDFSDCFGIDKSVARRGAKLGKLGAFGLEIVDNEVANLILKAVGQVGDVYHAFALAEHVYVVQSYPPFEDTHLGPPGHAPGAGKEVNFSIRVVSDFPDDKRVQCGPLVGLKFPKSGGVPDLDTEWSGDFENIDDLDSVGSVYDDEKTNSDGISHFTFLPAFERAPGVGTEQEEDGIVKVEISTLEPLGNKLGVPTDLLGAVHALFGMTIGYHIPAAWHLYAGWASSYKTLFHFLDGVECPAQAENALGAVQGPFDPHATWNWAMLAPDGLTVEHFTTGPLHPGDNQVGAAGNVEIGSSFADTDWDNALYWTTSVAWQQAQGPGNYLRAEPTPNFTRAGTPDEPTCD